MLHVDYEHYSAGLANLFDIKPVCGETIALDGKVLRVSYLLYIDKELLFEYSYIIVFDFRLMQFHRKFSLHKHKKTLSALTGATLGLAVLINVRPCQASSITTTFTSDNEQAGNMFDVTTFAKPLIVTSLDINVKQLNDPLNGVIDVYTKSGTYVGSETNPAAWTLVSSTPLASANPTDTPTFVDVTDFTLPANTTTGLYVLFQGQQDMSFVAGSNTNILAYTDGANTYSNADLSLSLGAGNRGTFGTTFSSRTWNGTISYTAVPEPSDLGGFSLAFLGGAWLIKKKIAPNTKMLKKQTFVSST